MPEPSWRLRPGDLPKLRCDPPPVFFDPTFARRIMKKIILLLIMAACVYGALSYHFILTDHSVKILKKTDLTFDNTFVDARGAKKSRLFLDPALLKAGVRDLFKEDSVTIGK